MALHTKRQDNLEKVLDGFDLPDLTDNNKDSFLGNKPAEDLKVTEEK
ncbi:MAG: hypothetical protein LBT80_05310 [Lactobacillaceae bacterium]|jgi:hypothetical protein|nr:hypothetical protein [Lactobacillaceae bacterium]